MGCQASAAPVMKARKAGKIARRLSLTIGLLCSKTFDDAIFPELFEAKYGIARADIAKMNIKGVFQVWTRTAAYHEIPLKEAHAWTREGCTSCPDFAAEHADISTGGIGAFNDWTLTLVRTEKGDGAPRRDDRPTGRQPSSRPGRATTTPGPSPSSTGWPGSAAKRWPGAAVAAAATAVPMPRPRGHLHRDGAAGASEGDLLAWVRARGTRRTRHRLTPPPPPETAPSLIGSRRAGAGSSCPWPNLWEPCH
jgi:hypothetical protein